MLRIMWIHISFEQKFLWRVFVLLSLTGEAFGASFYGDGLVHLKAVELSSQTSFHVRFRTSRPSGLLFLAAGETDFLWVGLHSGRVQVQIQLGSGERTVRPERGIPLNDLTWHTVELQHDHENITLTVDKNSITSVKMPGPDFELDVQDGLFVGGAGDLEKSYLSANEIPFGFRGCLDEILFNEHNLLSSLRPYSGYKMIHEVSLGCSPQFSATVNDSISFFSSKAYMSLPTWDVPQEGIFECELHTVHSEGILLYSSVGHGNYFALEIQKGHLVAIIKIGVTKTALRSLMVVNDGAWHILQLYLSPLNLHFTLGLEMHNSSFGINASALQFTGPLFLGGVDVSTYTEVQKYGLLSMVGKRIGGGSFKGCLRNIRVNYQRMGLPKALVTKDISVGCEPEKQLGPSTTSPLVITIDSENITDVLSGMDKRNFLLLKDLEVLEGGRAALESKHIKINLEFRKLGIRQSQIMFRVEEQPVHGQLRLDIDPDLGENTFSILDLWHGRVMYVHGGSEDLLDFFMFSIFTNVNKEVPSYLKGNRLHRFNISITPVNDAPELSLPEGSLFILLEHSRRHMSTDVLRVIDPDTNSTHLMFSVLGNLNADSGFLEIEEHPGRAVTSFSRSDLEQGKVSYVHKGVKNSRMAIRVSDGDKVSNTVVLRIITVPLEHKVANNTGVEVTQGEATFISNKHLAVQVNVPKQAVDIRYDITVPPVYGELQRLHSSGQWKQTSTFTQKLLEKERLRYLSTFHGTQQSNITDSFKCTVTVGSVITDELLFLIRVHWIRYRITRNKLAIDGEQKVTLTTQTFHVVTKGARILENDLHIRLLTLPRKGHILLDNKILKKNSTFSQDDITNHKLQYELLERPHDDTRDMFHFQVFSKFAMSGIHEFKITIKADIQNIILKNHGLSLLEGESKVITKAVLFSETPSSRAVHYTVTSSPKHGILKRINLSNSSASNDSIIEFTNPHISEEHILNVHDDSETTHDAFTFVASFGSLKNKTRGTEGTFIISIQLVNDQKPIRVVDKIFHVVRDSQRLLTLEDLCYHDADTDFNDKDLLYTRRKIPMGELVLVNDTTHKLYQFHQKDLEEKRVLFIHKGVSYGRFVLFISDGKHYTSTLLEVSAQDPFVKVANNTGLLVQKGQMANLGIANFSISTNMDVRHDEEVVFEVFLPPNHGTLYCNSIKANTFTQLDLKIGHVMYHHDDSEILKDIFNFTSKVKGLCLDASVLVKVYLESHQKPPRVIHNNPIVVEEGKPVKINKEVLQVVHEDNKPFEIVYTVKVAPTYGFLRISMLEEDHYRGSRENPIQSFSQGDINEGHIQFVQTEHGYVNDSFSLDVTNGVLTVRDLVVVVDIIPLYIPLEVSNMTLIEGSSKALTQDIIKVVKQHFHGLQIFYLVTEGPHYGRIEHSRIPGVPIPSFTRAQAEQGYIFYVHDGSETVADNFTVVASNTDIRKQSLPFVVYVNITSINDEPPIVTVNRILKVWEGSVTEITTEDLSSEDPDSPPESLEFIITPPSNGHLALKSAPSRPVLNFTQEHIHHGQLVFVHNGALSGGFHFQVNDGVNFAPRQIFSVAAQSLVISLEKNQELRVFPGSSKLITEDELLIITNDFDDIYGNRTITYTVTSPPRFGSLMWKHNENTTETISSFTQNMVKERALLYAQTKPVAWTATDSFTFTASCPPASLQTHTFNIHISYENTGPEHRSALLTNTGAVVAEGSSVLIDKPKLDASNLFGKLDEAERNFYEVWYEITSPPHHGTIVVGEKNLTHERPKFSQFNLHKHGIIYVHDDSETTHDNFTFDVWLIPKGKLAQRPQNADFIVSEIFNITVTPINDRPPVLKTGSPRLKVVKGDTVTLDPENLYVEDQDTPPEELFYTVISKPKNGFLALEGQLNKSVSTFTQADVNHGRVHFVQKGELSSGVIYFSITDGFHRPLYKLFSVEVENITISVVNNTGLTLLQGQTTVTLTFENLAAVTNERDASIKYLVTSPPSHGSLMVMEEPVTHFDQKDLHTGRIFYNMTDLSSPRDCFEFMVFTSESNLTNQVVNITVKPLIHLGEHVRIPDGIPVKLRKDVLDATELASLSASDPIFEILEPPKHGKLVKVTFDLGGASHSVESFSFRDVEQGRVAIEENINFHAIYGNTTAARYNVTVVHPLNDSFVFLLKAANVQPARGEFVYLVLPYDPITGKHILSEPTKLPTLNRTANVHIDPSTRPHMTASKLKPRNHGGNHTRSRSTVPHVPRTTMGKLDPSTKNTLVRMESLPRPASDPLLIILPLLACLLLIVILVVLILVFRHRSEKRAHPAMIQELTENPGEDILARGPYLGQPERSLAVPSVIVTPLTPSCPGSPVLQEVHDAALMPAIEQAVSPFLLCKWSPLNPDSAQQCSPTTPSLKQNQHWV
ncbi:chondroitin sulfate proteoglycan 4-like [Sinocyclocheilus anshuiensis]|uniref:chondroitin sulfate proteoglycan 4-like n=1 Tax=Sinocyclocheilus anshuiensis TaxID=1608454 RepID=UPI0007BA99D1|nr:PREDICTED: chondroitin sulfate proteoglycan 4-like [Sinocyclocheilus anshuiensis]